MKVNRRGVSLVELLIVISVASVIVGLCAKTIHVLLRTERDQARALRTTVTVSRLAEVFRDDVHESLDAEIVAAENQPLRLMLNDRSGGEVTYTFDAHQLHRQETAANRGAHRDTFYLPPGSTARVDKPDSAPRVRITLDLPSARPDDMPAPRRPTSPPRVLSIEATLGFDRRFAGREP